MTTRNKTTTTTTTTTTYGADVDRAAREYVARRDRNSHPDGEFDSAGRWYPSDSESQTCCSSVRSPSRAYPYSYMVHCRTAGHVAAVFGVDVRELRAAARLIDGPAAKPHREGGDNYYKAVAVRPDGTLVSIFDGQTVYALGVTLNGQARQEHQGGYYCYRSAEEARDVAVPERSVAADLPRKILRVRAEGNYCVYGNRKLAFSKITPVVVLA